MTNAYPELPILPYQKTTVSMDSVIAALNASDYSKEVKVAGYVMFRNESGNGQHGLNNNYCGIQADSGRWDGSLDKYIVGVVQKPENGTSKVRLFLAFHDVAGCLAFLLFKVEQRGLYVGGFANKVSKMQINDVIDWCLAYVRDWVTGDASAKLDGLRKINLITIYNAGLTHIK